MNLTELYQLRNYATGNTNKVINKDVFLSVLDSHIRAIAPTDEHYHSQDTKQPQRAFTEATRIDRIHHPPVRNEVLKKYKGSV